MKVSELREELSNYDDDVEVEIVEMEMNHSSPDFYVDYKDLNGKGKPHTIYIKAIEKESK